MRKRLMTVVAVAVSILLCAVAIEAKNWKKEDFAKLTGEDRIFHLSSIKLSVNGFDFQNSLEQELGFVLKNKNNTIPASIPMDELKNSIENTLGIIFDTTEFDKHYNERMKNGFFSTEPSYKGKIATYEWSVPNNKNRVAISIYFFKVGTRIRKNKAQINIQLLQYDPQKSEYIVLSTYKGKRVTWDKQTEIYGIIKKNCVIK